MKTIVERMAALRKEGFTHDFTVKNAFLTFEESAVAYKPDSVKIISFYRFEGESDPADNSILYAIETMDGLKGLLIDAYGTYADAGVNKFIRDVEDINKREATKGTRK